MNKAEIISAWIAWAARHGLSQETFMGGCKLLESDHEYYANAGFYSLESAARYIGTGYTTPKQERYIVRV